MLNNDFSPWPSYSNEEIEAVTSVLKSNKVNYWTGDQSRNFESEFSKYSQCSKAIALANGTLALDLAWKAIGLGSGDEVIVTPRTFLATVSSIILAGGRPVFADVSLDSQNVTAETVAPLINKNTRAICCVHLAGWPCDMDKLTDLARSYNISVVEDCAQAHGAKYRDRSVGGLGDIGAWSFCQDKIMTTGGEGGMVTTNSDDLWASMWSFKDHGKNWNKVYRHEHPPGFRWLHDSFGTNWRITEMQSAIGLKQIGYMPEWHKARTKNAESILNCARACSGLRVPVVPAHVTHAYYKCYVFIRNDRLKAGWSRDRVLSEINECGVPCFSGSCSEVYLESAFNNTEYAPKERLKNAKALGEESIMFLVHPTLLQSEIDKTCDVLVKTMARCTL